MAWTPDEDGKILAWRGENVSWPEIGRRLGKNWMAVKSHGARLLAKGVPAEAPPTHESALSDRVVTLEDLIAEAGIDLDVYEVERFVVNKYEMGAKLERTGLTYADGVKSGFVNVDGVVVTPLWQVKAWFKPRDGAEQRTIALGKALLADIRAESAAPRPLRVHKNISKDDWLFEFAPFDLHMGKYAWDEETVTDYDVEIAEDLFNESLDFLLDRALRLTDGKIGQILFPVGNDVSHVDSKRNQTTAGTQMDYDSRYIRVYRRICAVHRRAVDVLKQVAPVKIVVVPGNHDELTAFHLGSILEARYDDDPYVSIDNGARSRKYHAFGVNLFGFAHGDKEKVNELPLLMAREVPDLWAKCPSREWHIGHKHIAEKKTWAELPGVQDLFSDKGVRVRRLMSMSAHDAWHASNAYVDRRACDAFVFHRAAGFTDHLSFNIDHFSGKAVTP